MRKKVPGAVVSAGIPTSILSERRLRMLWSEATFVCESDGVVLASAIINSCQEPCYSGGDWTLGVNDSEVLVLHTLTVDPRMAGKGIGRSFVAFYKDYARANGYHSLRLDTQTVNDSGRRLYPRLGYRQADIVDTDFHGLRAIRLILFEKMI